MDMLASRSVFRPWRPWWSLVTFGTFVVHASPQNCTFGQAGLCRMTSNPDYVEICGSGKWTVMPRGTFVCENGGLVPAGPSSTLALSQLSENALQPATSGGSYTSNLLEGPTASATHSASTPYDGPSDRDVEPMRTGNSVCLPGSHSNRVRIDQWGLATYNSTMASVYDAAPGAAFRCNLSPPSNDFYVAVWTPPNGEQGSQPQPLNCGNYLGLTNPLTGKNTVARVIDRCASCVGLNRQTNDPSTPDCLVNGATVDLSRSLWNYLFDHAEGTVYNIEYNGTEYGGSCNVSQCTLPSPLTSPDCVSSSCPSN